MISPWKPLRPALQFGAVTLVPDERLVLKDGEAVPLTPKAFDLLASSRRIPVIATKEQLMQAVWADTAVEESNLSYHVFAIRRALGDTAKADRSSRPCRSVGTVSRRRVRVDRPNTLAASTSDGVIRLTQQPAPTIEVRRTVGWSRAPRLVLGPRAVAAGQRRLA